MQIEITRSNPPSTWAMKDFSTWRFIFYGCFLIGHRYDEQLLYSTDGRWTFKECQRCGWLNTIKRPGPYAITITTTDPDSDSYRTLCIGCGGMYPVKDSMCPKCGRLRCYL